jgi:hypothetical protein
MAGPVVLQRKDQVLKSAWLGADLRGFHQDRAGLKQARV